MVIVGGLNARTVMKPFMQTNYKKISLVVRSAITNIAYQVLQRVAFIGSG